MILQFPILISSIFKSTTKSLSFIEKKIIPPLKMIHNTVQCFLYFVAPYQQN